MALHNAVLSHDRVLTDFGIYTLTGDELRDPDVDAAAFKCKAAYDSGWYERKRWDEPLTAATELKNFQDFNSGTRRR